jgi:hypothetical protein
VFGVSNTLIRTTGDFDSVIFSASKHRKNLMVLKDAEKISYCSDNGGSMVGADRLNAPAIDTSDNGGGGLL